MGKIPFYFLLLQLLFLFASVYTDNESNEVDNIVQLINNRSDIVGPCEHFHDHVCHAWLNGLTKTNFFDEARERVYVIAKDILESPRTEEEGQKLSMEKEWYAKCMDTRRSNVAGYGVFRRIYNTAIMSPTWQEMNAFYATSFSRNLLFDVSLNEDNSFRIGRPKKFMLMLPRFDSQLDSVISNLNKRFTFYFEADNVTNNDEYSLKRLFRSYLEESSYNEESNIRMTVEEFQNKYNMNLRTEINWLQQLNAVGLNVQSSDVLSFDMEYLIRFNYIIRATHRAPNVIRRFIHLVYFYNIEVYNYWTPRNYMRPYERRAEICIAAMPIKDGFTKVILEDRLIGKTNFFVNVFDVVKKEYLKEIENSWLSGATKNWALSQINKTEIFSPGIYTHTKITTTYTYDFELGDSNAQSLLNFYAAQMQYIINQSQNRANRKKRDLHLNSARTKIFNTIGIIAEHILTPLFSLSAPVAWNYGHIATAIAHELSHTLDEIHFVINDELTINRYVNKVNCYINKSNKYVVHPRVHVNGIMVKNEIIADSVGLKVAYNALKKAMEVDERLNEERLPGLEDMDAEKLFFTAFAMMYCSLPKQPYELSDSHPPSFVRIMEAAKNSEKFQTAFTCGKTDVMFRDERCDLWGRPTPPTLEPTSTVLPPPLPMRPIQEPRQPTSGPTTPMPLPSGSSFQRVSRRKKSKCRIQ